MILAYIVYTVLAFTLCMLTYYVKKKNAKISFLFIPIILYSLLIGLRFKTGSDWVSYYDFYNEILSGGEVKLEFLYILLNKFIAFWGLKYYYLFITIAFLQISFLYNYLWKHKQILFWGIFFYFFLGPFFSSLNIIRQSIAFFVFLYAIQFIEKKNWIKYVFLMVIAFGFHTSSVILLPLYFVNRINVKFINMRLLLITLFILSIILGELILSRLFTSFFELIQVPQYSRYWLGFEDNTFSYGIGFWCLKLVDFILIIYAYKLSIIFKKCNLNIIWWIYYIGVLISNIGMANVLTLRLSYYMTSLKFILISYLCYYTFSIVKCKTKLVTCISLLIILLGIASYYSSIAQGHNGCSPYRFAI